jgi:hypothetical protein
MWAKLFSWCMSDKESLPSKKCRRCGDWFNPRFDYETLCYDCDEFDAKIYWDNKEKEKHQAEQEKLADMIAEKVAQKINDR